MIDELRRILDAYEASPSEETATEIQRALWERRSEIVHALERARALLATQEMAHSRKADLARAILSAERELARALEIR